MMTGDMDALISQYSLIFWPFLAFLAVVVLVPPMKCLAPYIGLLDLPDDRKQHEGRIPLIGGLVIFPIFMIVSVLALSVDAESYSLFGALLILLATGALDDKFHIHPFVKFGMQFLAAFLVVVPGGATLYGLGDLYGFGEFELGFMALPFSVVAVVLLINAINLMDGVDGLAGGISFVIFGWFLYAAYTGASPHTLTIALVMAVVAGFLVYNMRSPLRAKASIFMGDAGSMCLGLLVGWYAIKLSPVEARAIEPIAVAWVLAVPIWDECAQFYRRVREGRHPFSPDRGHLHHNFLSAGVSDAKTTLSIMVMVFVSGAIGVVGVNIGVPLPVLTVSWMVLILAHLFLARDLERYPRFIRKLS